VDMVFFAKVVAEVGDMSCLSAVSCIMWVV